MFPVTWQLLNMFQLSKCLQHLQNSICTYRTLRVSMELHKVKTKEKSTECFPKYFRINWMYYAVEVCWAFSIILTIYVDYSRAKLGFRVSRVGARCISSEIREGIISHFAQICSNTGGMWIMAIKRHNTQWTPNSKSSLYEGFLALRQYDVALR